MASKSRARRGRSFILIVALTIAGGTLAGASLASGAASGGGVIAPKPPKVTGLTCVDRCAGLREAAPKAEVQLTGRRLRYVERVRFPAQDGGVAVKPIKVSGRKVEAKVPDDAKNGKPRAVDEFGQVAKAPDALKIIPESELPEPGSFRLADATVSPSKSFFFGNGKPTLTYIFNGNGPTDVRIDVVRAKNGDTVRSWVEEDVTPNSEQKLAWNGAGDDKKPVKSGQYEFRIGGVGQRLRANGTSFGLYDHKFPVRGKHSYGDGVGAPRAGHSHQGQDVFAKCGVPIEAARGGKVQHKGYHSAAGNYVVVDGKKSRLDYVYMHLKNKAQVKQGERVKTGQKIGENGDTGNASGCHLHFEIWGKPGWYEGGSFLRSVTKKMKKWDKWS